MSHELRGSRNTFIKQGLKHFSSVVFRFVISNEKELSGFRQMFAIISSISVINFYIKGLSRSTVV